MPEEKCQCPLCADPSEAHYDKRDVYDEKILPLEEQIKEMCRAEGIPYLMNFQTLSEVVADGDDDGIDGDEDGNDPDEELDELN